MSLIPAFEIGLWNAWILMVYNLILAFLIPLVVRGREKEANFTVDLNKTEKNAILFMPIIYFILFLYSIFLPLRLGTTWFYIGLPISVLGAILLTMATLNFATSETGKPVSKGIYRYSRHPMYFGFFLIFIGIGLASASWLYLFFTLVLVFSTYYVVTIEERATIEKYGDASREYMNRAPRWIGIPKS